MAFGIEANSGQGHDRLPRNIRLRRGTVDDEFATFDVMRRAMGYEMLWTHHVAMRQHLRTQPDYSFWVAEEIGRFAPSRIVGYAASTLREGVWSLTEFFILPASQRQGIGQVLLQRCLEDTPETAVQTRLVLASHNFGANALYIRKLGCLPRLPMLLLSGSIAELRLPEEAPVVLETFVRKAGRPPVTRKEAPLGALLAEPLVWTPEVREEVDALDREIVGYARPGEHAHWATVMSGMAFLFRLVDQQRSAGDTRFPLAGYAYLGTHTSGPALAIDPAYLPAMLTHVTSVFRERYSDLGKSPFSPLLDHYWAIAGTNEIMLRWLLDCGWRIAFHYLLMSSRPLGRFDRYVCYNPLYIL